jgi:SAM-dependent MidA family methyltransferase
MTSLAEPIDNHTRLTEALFLVINKLFGALSIHRFQHAGESCYERMFCPRRALIADCERLLIKEL